MSSTGITLDSVVMNLDSAGSMTATWTSTGRLRAVDPTLVNDNDNDNNKNKGGGNGSTAATIGPRIMVDGGGGGRSSVRVFADCR